MEDGPPHAFRHRSGSAAPPPPGRQRHLRRGEAGREIRGGGGSLPRTRVGRAAASSVGTASGGRTSPLVRVLCKPLSNHHQCQRMRSHLSHKKKHCGLNNAKLKSDGHCIETLFRMTAGDTTRCAKLKSFTRRCQHHILEGKITKWLDKGETLLLEWACLSAFRASLPTHFFQQKKTSSALAGKSWKSDLNEFIAFPMGWLCRCLSIAVGRISERWRSRRLWGPSTIGWERGRYGGPSRGIRRGGWGGPPARPRRRSGRGAAAPRGRGRGGPRSGADPSRNWKTVEQC